MFFIRLLTPADAAEFQLFRLAALQREPDAFIASYEEEWQLNPSDVEAKLAPRDGSAWFGAHGTDGSIIGIASLMRNSRLKSRHQALLSGMAVAPHYRGQGVGRALLGEVLKYARAQNGLRQVQLVVNSNFTNAIHLYESVGFQAFGREPGALLFAGTLHDGLHMVLLM